ncbi:hypothetical protein BDF20DRAFT_831308 [Mycotypha africana]|uniref:uncharacterized protein n=1 Tax=Mycotypha africana TaxID=64632 RepID=UPI0023013471|nr:uncharacterized protein BDF20DRAFT_831308 [Mycotypha africana]KAI8991252.1 hypothetical protein BDF20DRAFT_831308 [Mycotypha africana]
MSANKEDKSIQSLKLEKKLDEQLNINGNNNNVTKKSNKKKKKSAGAGAVSAVTDIPEYYHQALSDYPVQLNTTKAKGRHAVAAKNLPEGTILCEEQGAAFVVRTPFIDAQCHLCFSSIKQRTVCPQCQKAYYCSSECFDSDSQRHALMCNGLKEIENIAQATDTDVDLLRLMVALMARRCLDKTKIDEESRKRRGLAPNTPFWCVEDLLSHRDKAEPAFIQVVSEASERLLSLLPPEMHIPVEEMVEIACRINANAHGLGDEHGRNTDTALGLFPIGALFFNHGCNPNTAFIGTSNGKLAFRTIRPVTGGEELVVSYDDIYADRDYRRATLLSTKHFWCKCKRCASSMDKSVDRFLTGVVCTSCQKDVYIIPATSVEHLSKGVSNLYLESRFKCASCGHETPAVKVRNAIEKAAEAYNTGLKMYRARNRDLGLVSTFFSSLVNNTVPKGGKLHPMNSIRLNAHSNLMNCKRGCNDLKGAIDVNKSNCEMFEQFATLYNLPGNTSEISDMWQNLAEMCEEMAEKTEASTVLRKKWLKEAAKAYERTLKIREVVFGKDHSKTKDTAKLLAKFSTF